MQFPPTEDGDLFMVLLMVLTFLFQTNVTKAITVVRLLVLTIKFQ